MHIHTSIPTSLHTRTERAELVSHPYTPESCIRTWHYGSV